VLQLSLYHPAHGVMLLSPQQDAELFRLTCGGYGLTGNIISARLKLKSVIAATAVVTFRPIAGIEELIREFNGSAGSADILFSWHDFTDFSASFGRGFIQEGRFAGTASSSPSPDKIAKQSLSAESRGNLPIKVFNRFSVRAMNILYGAKASKGESSVTLSLFDSMFPIQKSKELYFKFFGKVGFHEYQVVLPEERFAEYVDGVKQFLLKTPLPITLASAKLFSGKSDLLRFTGKGICFALNFPRQVEAQQFLPYLDQLLIKCGGIPNIIKDSRLSRAVVEACYPEYSQFRQRLHEYDPQRIYRSELSDRLGL